METPGSDFRAFTSAASYRTPERIVDSGWLGHGAFALWLVATLRPRLTVELGTHRGFSLAAFCQAIDAEKIDGQVIGVDTWRGDEHAGKYDDSIYEEVSAYFAARHARYCVLKRMYFAEALTDVADGTVDLLHVDGRHFYEDVREDYTSWIPKLSDRAVVLFHDTQVMERNFGVHRYWQELITEHPHFEFQHGNGLGVLGFGKSIPAPVASLLSPQLPVATRRDVQTVYARIGAAEIEAQRASHFEMRYNRRRNPLKRLATKLGLG